MINEIKTALRREGLGALVLFLLFLVVAITLRFPIP